MTAVIVRSNGVIVLVGAGHVTDHDLDLVQEYGNLVVAADGGAKACVNHGIVPDAVIGDMDSVDESVLAGLPPDRIHRIEEQETTDFDKCLRSVEAPLILAVGFAGPRLDHTLAVFNSLVRHRDRRVLLVGARELAFHLAEDIALDLPEGTGVSLFPMRAVRVASQGLRWPTDGIDFAPSGRIGTSNEVTGRLRLTPEGPGMLVITPRVELPAVLSALRG